MITIGLDEKDKPVVRATIAYLQALIGESQGSNITISAPVVTFNDAELAEAEQLTVYGNDVDKINPAEVFATTPSAAEVFGGKPNAAPSIAAAGPLSTVPVDMTATTSIPTPPSVPSPPAANTAPPAAHAAHHTANHAAGVELDTNGLPWDGRIHSREKSKIKNGTWKYKRGVEDATIAEVEAALRNLMAIPATPSAPVAAPVPTPPPPSPLDPAGTVSAPVVTLQPVQTPAITAPTANPSSAPELPPVPALISKITAAQAAGQLTQDQLIAVLVAHGLQTLPDVFKRPDLAPTITASIDATIAANVGV